MRELLKSLTLAVLLPAGICAADPGTIVRAAVDQHVVPRFAALSGRADELVQASSSCSTASGMLEEAYHHAADAWIAASHLRFGPTETGDRAFAIAFWPDTKGFTPKVLTNLLTTEDPIVQDVEQFATLSIAGRGLYALEFLLFDDRISQMGASDYRCALAHAIAVDIQGNAAGILQDWQEDFAQGLIAPGQGHGPYQTTDESVQELFKALDAGLQMTADMRLGRPLGRFDRPRPKRAENWRSGRSLHNVVVALEALRDLAAVLAANDAVLAQELDQGFTRALTAAKRLNDPIFASVDDPQGRFRVEALKQRIDDVRTIVSTRLGPSLGVAAGFNSLDGD